MRVKEKNTGRDDGLYSLAGGRRPARSESRAAREPRLPGAAYPHKAYSGGEGLPKPEDDLTLGQPCRTNAVEVNSNAQSLQSFLVNLAK